MPCLLHQNTNLFETVCAPPSWQVGSMGLPLWHNTRSELGYSPICPTYGGAGGSDWALRMLYQIHPAAAGFRRGRGGETAFAVLMWYHIRKADMIRDFNGRPMGMANDTMKTAFSWYHNRRENSFAVFGRLRAATCRKTACCAC